MPSESDATIPMQYAGSPHTRPHLERRFGLIQATSLNMVNMVGAGPFITIPLIMSAMGGPQALLGWLLAICICLPDGLIWSELGAALPGSGGSYVYLRECFGVRWGRFMAFMFIWQFILSGPLEIASGYIGFGRYANYIWPQLTALQISFVAAALGLFNILLLFRGISAIGRLAVGMWVLMLVTVGGVIVTGLIHFDRKIAFNFPPGAFNLSWGFLWGLGSAARFGIYDYLGYYDVCYIGEEVREPGRVIPKSVLLSLMGVAFLYFVMNLSIIGSVSWREFVPATEQNRVANYLVSVLMERMWGHRVAVAFTVMILITIFAGCFALLLGYSRIPYAAARDGGFFRVFGTLHPTKHFPWVSLLAVGLISVACCFISLSTVIDALLATRIVVQFMGQAVGVILLRRRTPELARPYRLWLYPLPCFIALVGWVFVFLTSGRQIMLYSAVTLAMGVVAFMFWSAFGRNEMPRSNT